MSDTTKVNKLVSELFKGTAVFLNREYNGDPGHANKYRTIADNTKADGFIGYPGRKAYGKVQDLVPGIDEGDVAAAVGLFKTEMSNMGMNRANKGTHPSGVTGELLEKANEYAAKAGKRSEGPALPSFDNIEVPRISTSLPVVDTSRTV